LEYVLTAGLEQAVKAVGADANVHRYLRGNYSDSGRESKWDVMRGVMRDA
jgi:hypothetical protein